MQPILSEQHDHTLWITLNRADVRNAFDDHLLKQFLIILNTAYQNPTLRLIVLKSQGETFSAGADLAWMQRMITWSEEENHQDALLLANLMHTLHHSPIPTLAMVQGDAFGGGAGLVAACDMAIAANTARFCFSEVKLGLIPAVISPYVVRAIGERAAGWLFMSGECIDAQRAQALQLVQHCVEPEELLRHTQHFAERLNLCAPQAVRETKTLLRYLRHHALDDALPEETAARIAKKRVSSEGQQGLNAFLTKTTPHWDPSCLKKS